MARNLDVGGDVLRVVQKSELRLKSPIYDVLDDYFGLVPGQIGPKVVTRVTRVAHSNTGIQHMTIIDSILSNDEDDFDLPEFSDADVGNDDDVDFLGEEPTGPADHINDLYA